MATYRMVLCTAPVEGARELARGLVEAQLAACVNLVPGLRSLYRWRGEVCEEGESLLVIKTTGERIEELTRWIIEHHPYDVPEVLSVSVEPGEGNGAYLRWLEESVMGAGVATREDGGGVSEETGAVSGGSGWGGANQSGAT